VPHSSADGSKSADQADQFGGFFHIMTPLPFERAIDLEPIIENRESQRIRPKPEMV